MNDQATYRMKGKVVLRRIGADRLLVPVSSEPELESCVFPLNDSGVFIWEGLSKGKTVAEVAQGLAAAFEVEPEAALADCRAYARELVAQKLMEVIES